MISRQCCVPPLFPLPATWLLWLLGHAPTSRPGAATTRWMNERQHPLAHSDPMHPLQSQQARAMMERPHDDDREEAEAATRRLLRQALLEAVPGIPEGDVDDAILDYCIAMLTEEADDNESDSSSSSYAYDDEAARGILGAYLQLGEEDDDDGEASSSALEALDVAGLRARLRGVVAEAAVAARERRAVEARRALSLSSLASSLSRSGVGGEEALEPSDHAAAAAGAVEEEEGDGDDDSLMEQHGEALDFLVQLLPEGTDPRVVAFAFRVKCLFDRDQAADLLLQVAGEEGAMAALEAERAKCEASRREAKEARRREQEAAEAAARKAIVDRFADEVVTHGSSSSSSASASGGRRAPAPIPLPAPPEETRVRYHQNQRVELPKGSHTKKYLIESVTPEWDGGSKGRVKTKGKRGPGFV